MPLTKFQSYVLRTLAAQRSPDSYVAGGVALNREGPRFSGDIDIFQDSEERLASAAEADAKALVEAGLKFSWRKIQTGKRQAEVELTGESMQLECVADSDLRFFPRSRMSFLVMCCTLLTLPRIRRPLQRTVENPAICSTL